MKTLYFYIGECAKRLEECEVCISCRPDDALLGETALGRCVELEVADETFHAIAFLQSLEYGNEYIIDRLFALLSRMFQEGVKAARKEDGDRVEELKHRIRPAVDEMTRASEEASATLNKVLALLHGDITASDT